MPQSSASAGGFTKATAQADAIRTAFEDREFGRAVRLAMEVADGINAEIASFEPWILAKDAATNADSRQRLADICRSSMAGFKALTLFLKPILPKLASDAETYLRSGPLTWGLLSATSNIESFLPAGHEFGAFKPLITRVDAKQLENLFEPATAAASVSAPAQAAPAAAAPVATPSNEITVEDFAKLDLRIAKILAAEAVEGADKLLKLSLDVGEGQRTVFAGIRSAYAPEQLVGRLTVVLANLKPRKMRFGTSEGMVLAAGPGGKDLFILSPDSGAQAGMKVK
jgi:methionyl-tRNA synthetase